MHDPLEPTTRDLLWDDSVEVLCFGAATGNWAIRGMTREENESFNPAMVGRLRGLIERHRISRLYIPSPGRFNSQMAQPDDLTVRWPGMQVYRGAYAEGVTLEKIGEAVGIASSDCPTVIARNASSLLALAAHAGRDSLYDTAEMYSGKPAKRSPSVVDEIVGRLAPDGRGIDGIWTHQTCGIGHLSFAHRADDPVHGDRNRRILEHLGSRWGEHCVSQGLLNLGAVIASQFRAKGVPNERMSYRHDCTFSHTDGAGRLRWHSHRRDKDGKRNFVLAVRRK